jgi:hypothetical protein
MKIFSRLCTRFSACVAIAASVVALSVSLVLVAAPAGASGNTIDWTGNGTNAGLCASSESIGGVTVSDGQQAWLFILSSPDTGPFTITTTFLPAGDTSANGTQQGNGSVHFVVFSPLGAKLTSASAGPGTDGSVLTVSGCQDGAPASTTTTTDPPDTTTTTDPPDTTTTTDPPDTTTTTDPPDTTTTTDPPDTTTTTTTTGGNTTGGNTTGGNTTGGNTTGGNTTGGNTTGGNGTGGNTTGGNTTDGNGTGGNTTGGPSAPANVVFTPGGGTIVATAAPSTPMNHSGLAFTGADTAAMVAAGLALIGIGSALILLARSRRRTAQLG